MTRIPCNLNYLLIFKNFYNILRIITYFRISTYFRKSLILTIIKCYDNLLFFSISIELKGLKILLFKEMCTYTYSKIFNFTLNTKDISYMISLKMNFLSKL